MRKSLTEKPELRELNAAELEAVTGAALLQTSLQSSTLSKQAIAMRDDLVAFVKKANQSLQFNPLDRP
jgi:hypothetical protein